MDIAKVSISFKISQPIAFTTLSRIIGSGKISHAYLISADKGSTAKDAVWYLAAAISAKRAFSNEDENIQRMPFNLPSLIFLDGSKKIIQKEEIKEAISELSKKTLEQGARKLLVIEALDNMSLAASNSLLKFLEDPTSETYFIFSTNNVGKILPTISSRTNHIKLRRENVQTKLKQLTLNFPKLMDPLLFARVLDRTDIDQKQMNDYVWLKGEIINAFELIKSEPTSVNKAFFNLIVKSTNISLTLEIINQFLNDIWRIQNEVAISFESTRGLLIYYSEQKFDYEQAISAIVDLKNALLKHANLNLATSNFCLKLRGFNG